MESVGPETATTFVLHGGLPDDSLDTVQRFFHEILDVSSPRKILVLCFSRGEADWDATFRMHRRRFIQVSESKALEVLMAVKDPYGLAEQIAGADVIYGCSGRTGGLKARLRRIEGLPDLLRGKVVAGSSAGANVWSRYYFNRREQTIDSGLGLMPVNIFCHYDDARRGALMRLGQQGVAFETIPLREGEFVTRTFSIPAVPLV